MGTYAIVETGGKQYWVQPGDRLRVESIDCDEGDLVELSNVLMVSRDGDVVLGTPKVEGVVVTAQAVGEGRGSKTVVFKYKRKTRYRRRRGHRQPYTDLRVTAISAQEIPNGA